MITSHMLLEMLCTRLLMFRIKSLTFLVIMFDKRFSLRFKRHNFFTVIADEVTDCSNKEQLNLVLRFVDRESSQIRKDFIECDTGVTSRNLADKMLSFLQSQGGDLTKMYGQLTMELGAWLAKPMAQLL